MDAVYKTGAEPIDGFMCCMTFHSVTTTRQHSTIPTKQMRIFKRKTRVLRVLRVEKIKREMIIGMSIDARDVTMRM